MMTKQTEALKMAMGVLLSINQGKQHLIVIDDDRGFFQREEWVRWAIDEVVPQIKEALEQPSVAELNDEYLRDTHVEGLQPLTRDWKETIDERVAKDDAFKQALEQPAQEPVIVAIAQNEPPRVMLQDKINGKYMCFDVDSFVQAHLATEQINGFFNAITHPAPSWQELSDGDIQEHLGDELVTLHGWSFVQGVRWANKKLKEKNNAV